MELGCDAQLAKNTREKAQSFDWASQFTGGADGEMDVVQLKHKGLQAGTELPVASRSPVCCPLFPYPVRKYQKAKRPSRLGRPSN
jgi:hypothetical protein